MSEEIDNRKPEAERRLAPVSLLGCAICGGRIVEARGRHPGDAPRIVCPTCLADRLDMIREIAAPEYGRACSAHPNRNRLLARLGNSVRVQWEVVTPGPFCDTENLMSTRLEGEVIGSRSGFLGIGSWLIVRMDNGGIVTVDADDARALPNTPAHRPAQKGKHG